MDLNGYIVVSLDGEWGLLSNKFIYCVAGGSASEDWEESVGRRVEAAGGRSSVVPPGLFFFNRELWIFFKPVIYHPFETAIHQKTSINQGQLQSKANRSLLKRNVIFNRKRFLRDSAKRLHNHRLGGIPHTTIVFIS
jgi:hypothetical protein